MNTFIVFFLIVATALALAGAYDIMYLAYVAPFIFAYIMYNWYKDRKED